MELIKWSNPVWRKAEGKAGFKASLLIPFYNKIHELKMILPSCENQSFQDFEIVICDDGSREEVTRELKKIAEISSLAIQYVWHEDKGFRKNRILNHGILASKSEYLIFIDGDTIIHPEFVREHFEHRRHGIVLSGRGLEFSPFISSLLTPEKVKKGYIEKNLWWMLMAIMFRKDNTGIRGVYLKSPWLRKRINRKFRPLLGRNFSLHKEDVLKINGFNMIYEGVGIGEDSDFQYRLELMGVKVASFANIAVQYHVYHPMKKRENNNHEIFKQVREKNEAVTKSGLMELLKEIGSMDTVSENPKN